MSYLFNKAVASDRLELEIRSSPIVTALSHLTATATTVTAHFNAELSEGDSTILSNLVSAHVATPLPQNLVTSVAIKETAPFARPDYRTRRNASDLVTILASEVRVMDFLLTEELYVSGGDLIFSGAKVGDWISAEIHDSNGIIPAPYRPAICEAWPTVAVYLVKQFVPPGEGYFTINTYPLNAKVTPGLILRVTYTACDDASTRKVAINYHLTKKL